MFEIFVEGHFSSAHSLRGYRGNCEKVHGHNWQVKAFVQAKKLDRTGLALDFRILKNRLQMVLDLLDHQDLNKLVFFKKTNPSAENISFFIFSKLKSRIKQPGLKLAKIEVRETPDSGAIYTENH